MIRSASNHTYVPVRFSPDIYFACSQLTKQHKTSSILQRRSCKTFSNELERKKRLKQHLKPCRTYPRDINRVKGFKLHRMASEFPAGLQSYDSTSALCMMNIMYLNGKSLSFKSLTKYMVQCHMHGSYQVYLPRKYGSILWSAGKLTILTGATNCMQVDPASCFGQSADIGLFVHLAATSKVLLEETGTEPYASLGRGERYHQPPHQTYPKIMSQQPNSETQIALALAIKAMNDPLGQE